MQFVHRFTGFNDAEAHASEEPPGNGSLSHSQSSASMMPRLTPRKNPRHRRSYCLLLICFNDAEAHASEEPQEQRPRSNSRRPRFNDAEAHASEEPKAAWGPLHIHRAASMMPRLTPRKNGACRLCPWNRRIGFNDAEAHASEEPNEIRLGVEFNRIASMMPRLAPRKNPANSM